MVAILSTGPTEIEKKKWQLNHPAPTKFGLRTTYSDSSYHAFLSVHYLSERFLKECKEALPQYYFRLQIKKLRD
jgi:hypothetical protein